MQLLRGTVIREPLLVISPWFEQRRNRYQSALLELSCGGDWDAWIAFFAEAIRTLVALGILEPAYRSSRGTQLYRAPRVLNVLFD